MIQEERSKGVDESGFLAISSRLSEGGVNLAQRKSHHNKAHNGYDYAPQQWRAFDRPMGNFAHPQAPSQLLLEETSN